MRERGRKGEEKILRLHLTSVSFQGHMCLQEATRHHTLDLYRALPLSLTGSGSNFGSYSASLMLNTEDNV